MTDPVIAAKAQMLIRRPVREVRDWEMYGVSAQVDVVSVEENERIVIEWPYGPKQTRTTVEWTFTPVADDRTFVRVTNFGFSGTPDEIAEQAVDSTGGFSFLLAGAKALLEHDVVLNLVADHAPPEGRQP